MVKITAVNKPLETEALVVTTRDWIDLLESSWNYDNNVVFVDSVDIVNITRESHKDSDIVGYIIISRGRYKFINKDKFDKLYYEKDKK
jgi:hypothetical protein